MSNKKNEKVGGYGNIKPHNNPKPFTKQYNGSDFTKWKEIDVHKILNELEDWLFLEKEIFDNEGKVIGKIDAGNCFYRDFLYRRKLYDNWINNMKEKYTTVKERMKNIDNIQEHKLQLLAATGKQKENITKFILANKYNWSEKGETKSDINITTQNIKDLLGFDE